MLPSVPAVTYGPSPVTYGTEAPSTPVRHEHNLSSPTGAAFHLRHRDASREGEIRWFSLTSGS